MRLLLVTHGVKDTSTAVYRNTLGRARFLRRLGHDARVLTPEDVGLGHGRLLPIVFPFFVAWWVLRRPPFDVVAFHSHTGCVFQSIRRLARSHRPTSVAVTFHGLDVLYVRAMEAESVRRGVRQTRRFRLLHEHVLPKVARWSCRRADRVFCMNERERRFLLEHEWSDATRIRWMPNCVEPSDFVARAPVSGPVRLLTLAQWLPVKGTSFLVEAFTAIVRKGLDVRLTCAGTRLAAEQVLRDFPEDVRARVTVVPRLGHEEVHRMYAGADIFVLASVFEGFSIALLEAMAAGLAIVATEAGAAREILEADRDAALVPVADARALASALESLVRDEPRRREYGEQAQLRARAFVCEDVLQQFANDLIGGPYVFAVHA